VCAASSLAATTVHLPISVFCILFGRALSLLTVSFLHLDGTSALRLLPTAAAAAADGSSAASLHSLRSSSLDEDEFACSSASISSLSASAA